MITAGQIARHYEAHLSTFKDGDQQPDVDAWLARFWRSDCPPEPDTCPDAVTFVGGANGGGAVRWYETDGAILGFVPGVSRQCFWVPGSAVEPTSDDVLDDNGPPCAGDEHDWRSRTDWTPVGDELGADLGLSG
jgi:hypothetical protein